MKTSAKLIKYFLRQSTSVQLLLQKPSLDFSAEDFHMLRVHIKKLKAIFSLTDACVKNLKKDKLFKPFQTVFRQAGKVRELQLQISLLKKYKQDPVLAGYYKKIESDIQKERADFFKLADDKFKRGLKKKTKQSLPYLGKVNSGEVRKFLLEKRNHIEELMKSGKPEVDQVHELRIRFKELYYLQKIFQPKTKRLSIADDFQEIVGQWHDYYVISNDLLKDAQNHKLLPIEVKAIMTLQKKIATHADRLFHKIEFAKAIV
ncbi:MAG TPA: CHAD domain-containing protein [Saprospiraceae bacterium]